MGGIHIFLCLFFLCYIISLSNALFSFDIFTGSKAVGEALGGGKEVSATDAADAIDKFILKPYDTYDKVTSVDGAIDNAITAFNNTKGVDSVLAVNKNDYDSCNTNNPINPKMDGGQFDISSPLYFIAGNNCKQGQKFALVVKQASPPAGSPPADSPPADSPPPPPAFAAKTLTPSVAVVASVWVVTSLALGSFVTTY